MNLAKFMVVAVAAVVFAAMPSMTIYWRSSAGRSTRGLWRVAAIAFVVGSLAFLGTCRFLDSRGRGDESSPGPACNSRAEAARYAWLATARREWGDASPHDSGFRVGGACTTEVHATELSCDRDEVLSINADSPFLASALKVGFRIYVCEPADGRPSVSPATHDRETLNRSVMDDGPARFGGFGVSGSQPRWRLVDTRPAMQSDPISVIF